MKRPLAKAFLVVALGLFAASYASACGSDARATDACRRIESTRCERAPQCPTEYPDFTKTYGDVASCQRFYDTQCGRGVQEIAKEPSKSELEACITQIKSDCKAVGDPAKFCAFLTANDTPVDTGATDTGTATEVAADGG